MTSTARSLNCFPLVRTRNADEMCDALARVYAEPSLSLERRAKNGTATLNYCQMSNIGLGYSKYGLGVNLAYHGSALTLQTFPVRGTGQAIINNVPSPVGPGRGIIVSAGVNYAVRIHAGYEHFVLVINTDALTNKLAALTGSSINRPLRFCSTGDDERPGAKSLRDHFLFLVDRMSAAAGMLPELVLAEFEQVLIVMFLHANRHNYSQLLEQTPPDAALRQVRQAEEYIEANAHRPISLEELAQLTGVSMFSLFSAFKKHRGYSPLQFLSQARSRRRARQ